MNNPKRDLSRIVEEMKNTVASYLEQGAASDPDFDRMYGAQVDHLMEQLDAELAASLPEDKRATFLSQVQRNRRKV